MKKITLGLSLLALGIAGTAIAAAERGPGMDPLGDKTVTKAEFLASHGDMFAKMDANKDGKLDAADRAAHQGQMQGQMFDKLDNDHNGSISREEFTAGHQRGGDRTGHGQREGKHGGKHGGTRGGMMMKMADANKDGAVTRDELQAAATKHFDMMDANKDGKLTKEERQAARDKMRAMKGGKRGGQGPGPHAGHDMPPPPSN